MLHVASRRLHVEMAVHLQVKLRPYLVQNYLARGAEYFVVHLRHTINDPLIGVAAARAVDKVGRVVSRSIRSDGTYQAIRGRRGGGVGSYNGEVIADVIMIDRRTRPRRIFAVTLTLIGFLSVSE